MYAQNTAPQEGKGSKPIKGQIADRVHRGIELFAERGHEIEWLDESTCLVPSCAGSGKYRVVFGATGEVCTCPDFTYHAAELGICKHSAAAMISRVKGNASERSSERSSEAPLYHWVERYASIRGVDGRIYSDALVVCERFDTSREHDVIHHLPDGDYLVWRSGSCLPRREGEIVARCRSHEGARRTRRKIQEREGVAL